MGGITNFKETEKRKEVHQVEKERRNQERHRERGGGGREKERREEIQTDTLI